MDIEEHRAQKRLVAILQGETIVRGTDIVDTMHTLTVSIEQKVSLV